MTAAATSAAVAYQHYRNSRRITLAAVRAAIAVWRLLDPGALARSWERDGVGAELVRAATTAKLVAAREATPYVERMVPTPRRLAAPKLNPASLARDAIDGRPLDETMFQPVSKALQAMRAGALVDEAMRLGEQSAALIMANEVASTGRTADMIAMATEPEISGYIRLLNPPSCGRCVILAGRVYRWNADFERHPNCDCTAIPITETPDREELVDPRKAVEADEVRNLSKADREAILLGANPAQVINAHQGMYTLDGLKYTRAGTTKRGIAGMRLGRGVRRMRPAAIFAQAGNDRRLATQLLYQHGYIV